MRRLSLACLGLSASLMLASGSGSAQTGLTAAAGACLSPIGQGFAGNTVNVTIFRKNSVTTHAGHQYAAFYNQDGNVVLARRATGSAQWQIRTTPYAGNVRDAHNGISIAVDGTGVVHVAWDHHATPLRYARGNAPGSLELGEPSPMTGRRETRVTYPEFYNLADGGLLFIYRDGSSGSGNLVMNRYDAGAGRWQQLHENLIDGQGERNAYWQAAVDDRGVIHVSWVWRESGDVATNHDLCYAKSTDGGATWERSSGAKYTLPITAASAEVAVPVPQRHELINQTSMTTDSKGRPYIATYWRDDRDDIPQYRVVFHDGSAWRVSTIGAQTVPFRLGGTGTKRIPISRPQILADAAGSADRAYLLFRDEGRGNRVSVAICDDLRTGQWRVQDLTSSAVGQWEPTFDGALWRQRRLMHVFVQRAEQRDGEGVAAVPPERAYILEWTPR
jgi:hypothetical protein